MVKVAILKRLLIASVRKGDIYEQRRCRNRHDSDRQITMRVGGFAQVASLSAAVA